MFYIFQYIKLNIEEPHPSVPISMQRYQITLKLNSEFKFLPFVRFALGM